MILTAESFAKYFDHTLLRADARAREFAVLCADSAKYGFAMVAINPAAIALCKKHLENSTVRVGAAIGFPLGANTIEAKLFETKDAISKGADEIDYVINLLELKSASDAYYRRQSDDSVSDNKQSKNYPDNGFMPDFSFIMEEMSLIVNECKNSGVTSKVIFENCYLTEIEKQALCALAAEIGPDYIKTSTGFGPGGATLDDVRLMNRELAKHAADARVKIKAAGGIRTLDHALDMIRAGASRLGSSSSVAILDDFIKLYGKGGCEI